MRREDYLTFILAQEGVPYIWASKGLELKLRAATSPRPLPNLAGFDCSGLVTCGIWAASNGEIDWRANYNCNKLFMALDDVTPNAPKPGDLAFYGFGKNMLTHVMTVMPDGRVYGACGGGHTCTTPAIASKLDAKVRFRPNAKYREDFISFKRLPF